MASINRIDKPCYGGKNLDFITKNRTLLTYVNRNCVVYNSMFSFHYCHSTPSVTNPNSLNSPTQVPKLPPSHPSPWSCIPSDISKWRSLLRLYLNSWFLNVKCKVYCTNIVALHAIFVINFHDLISSYSAKKFCYGQWQSFHAHTLL